MGDKRAVLRDDEVDVALYTSREGMLSAVGHDLRLKARRSTWTWDRDAHTLTASIEAGSITVESAREGDRDAPGALSESDRKKIEASMRDDVLKVKKHPEVLVSATVTVEGESAKVRGTVTIVGAAQPFEVTAQSDGARWRASYTVDQTRFGIKPFTALLGTLKVARDVRVDVSFAAERVA